MRSRTKFVMGIMVFVILVFSSSVFIYKNIIDTIKSNYNITAEAFKEEQFKVLWSSLGELQLQSEKEVSEISKNIENDILKLSSKDLEQLQFDMTNNYHNEKLHNILMKNIQGKNLNGINNHRNGIVVMTTKGFIEDSNYRRAEHNANNNSTFRPWEYNIENSYNKELEKNAIDKLLNRTSGIIVFETYDLVKNDDHIKIKEMNYESLLEVYLREGLEGLRNYQIFVPYYITDIGDIFGAVDIVHGIQVDNNKIIVAQEFNLYDQIMSSNDNLFSNAEIKNLLNRYDDILRLLYIFGIALVMGICGVIFYFCSMHNNIIELEYEQEEIISQLENEALRTDKMQNKDA